MASQLLQEASSHTLIAAQKLLILLIHTSHFNWTIVVSSLILCILPIYPFFFTTHFLYLFELIVFTAIYIILFYEMINYKWYIFVLNSQLLER